MADTATVRDLRNDFPRVRKLIDRDGEVIVTDRGTPKYRLVPYTVEAAQGATQTKDYMARIRRTQPRPLSAAAAKALHQTNRADR